MSRGIAILMWVIGAALIVCGGVLFLHGQVRGVVLIVAGLIIGPVPWQDER